MFTLIDHNFADLKKKEIIKN